MTWPAGRLRSGVDWSEWWPLAANVSAHSVLYITASVGLALVVGLTAAGAGVYDAVVEQDGISGLDPAMNQSIAHRTATNTQLLTAFTHLGGPIGMTIIASVITIAMVWRWRSRTPLILMLIGVAGSLTMTSVGKAIVGRLRELHPRRLPTGILR